MSYLECIGHLVLGMVVEKRQRASHTRVGKEHVKVAVAWSAAETNGKHFCDIRWPLANRPLARAALARTGYTVGDHALVRVVVAQVCLERERLADRDSTRGVGAAAPPRDA